MIEERLDQQLVALNERYQRLFYSSFNEKEIKKNRYLNNIKTFNFKRIVEDLKYREYAKTHFSLAGNEITCISHKIDVSDLKIAVYSCIVGKYDTVIEPVYKEDEIDYLMFTDQDIEWGSAWKIIDLKVDPHYDLLTPTQLNRKIKILQTDELRKYDYTVYVDGNIEVVAGISPIIANMGRNGFGVHYHKSRDCIYDEVVAVKHLKRVSGEEMDQQIDSYRSEGFPPHYGLYENSILIRNNKDVETQHLMEAWWDEYCRYPTRDQLSLPYVIWREGYKKGKIQILGNDVERNTRFNRINNHL